MKIGSKQKIQIAKETPYDNTSSGLTSKEVQSAIDELAATTDSDEKVKYDNLDSTAGYLSDKVIAGTGINVDEGIGANENKLEISTDPNGHFDTIQLNTGLVAPAHSEGLLFWDQDDKTLAFHSDIVGVTNQIGQENWVKVVNKTGITINNGTVVRVSGAQGNRPTIVLADTTALTHACVLGIVTADIANNEEGYVTVLGLVRGIDTRGFSEGDILYLDTTTPGSITNVRPSCPDVVVKLGIALNSTVNGAILVRIELGHSLSEMHDVDVTSPVTGEVLKYNGTCWINDDPNLVAKDPTGFPNRTDSSISFVAGTFTISPVGASFNYLIKGVKYTKTSPDSLVISNDEGLHYLYYDGDILKETTTWSNELISDDALISFIHWDATNSKQIYFADERHGFMPWQTHLNLHLTDGTKLQYGGDLGDIVANGNGDLATHAQFSVVETSIHDEDINLILSARASTENISIYYRLGNDIDLIWRMDETASFCVLPTGTGRAAWNELNAGVWSLTEVGNNRFCDVHVFAYNDPDRKFGIVMGQNTYGNVSKARDGAEIEINNIILAGTPSEEIKFLGTLIIQTSNAYGNTVKSRIRSTNEGADYIDVRGSVIGRSGISSLVTTHNSLAGLQGGTSEEYYHLTSAEHINVLDHVADILTNPHAVTYTQVGAAPTVHSHVEADITDLDHNALKIKGVAVDDTSIADGYALTYDLASNKLVYAAAGGGGSALEIKDEGVSKDTSVVEIDFTGAGVTATQTAAGIIQVAIPGGAGFDPNVDALAIGSDALASGTNSTSIGHDTDATGLRATALGYGAQATAQDTIAIGTNAVSSGTKSIALGYSADALTTNSIAIGNIAQAKTADDAIAIGTSAETVGQRAIAIGYLAKASSGYSVAIGYAAQATTNTHTLAFGPSAIASGVYSTAIGSGAQASGSSGLALGMYSEATASFSVALGYDAVAGHSRSVAIGIAAETSYAYEIRLGESHSSSRLTIGADKGKVAGLNFSMDSKELADDAFTRDTTVTSESGWGWVSAGDNEEYAIFVFSSTAVTLLHNSTNIAVADTDTNLCVYPAGTYLTIKNRLGSSKTIKYAIFGSGA